MGSYYFEVDTYLRLLALMEAIDEELETNYAADFVNFFTQQPGTGFYVVTNLTEYTSWLAALGESDPNSDWFAWDGTIQIKSTEGGGQL